MTLHSCRASVQSPPLLWSRQEDGEQSQLLCLVQGVSDVSVTIWFSNGNGTNLGTTHEISPRPSPKSMVRPRNQQLTLLSRQGLLYNLPNVLSNLIPASSEGLSPRLISSSSSQGPSSQLFSTPYSEGPSSQLLSSTSKEGLSMFSMMSLSSEELRSWDSVTCFVAEAIGSNVWKSPRLDYPGDALSDLCHEVNYSLESALILTLDVLLLLMLRLMIFKLAAFNLLMTCAAILEMER
ncbi:uncharacterized protein O3C94_005386 isoform 2-T2 [Discoglossus pictus]